MKVTFPFEYITTNSFGHVFRPYATIAVWVKDVSIYINRTLVVDTGADFTVFPRNDAFLFGIDLKKETIKQETFGIGGAEIIFLYENLKIKIGEKTLKIPVGFLNNNDIPPLLGRQQFLELFSVCFEDYTTVFKKN